VGEHSALSTLTSCYFECSFVLLRILFPHTRCIMTGYSICEHCDNLICYEMVMEKLLLCNKYIYNNLVNRKS
jgi:hypothetical protein